MSLSRLRDEYGVRWLEFLRQMAETLELGRKRLVVHYPEIEHERSASSVLPRARVAVGDVIAAIERRFEHFRRKTKLVRSGHEWRELEKDFLAACAVVRGVCETFCMAIAVMLGDDDDLSELPATDPGRLTYLQRVLLLEAREQLEAKTSTLLAEAERVFVGR